MKNLFTLFLGVYVIFLGHHVWHEFSWVIVFGFIVAIFGHIAKNWLAPSVLVGHVAIEWFEWIQNPTHLLFWAFRAVHTGMDFAFFHHEIIAHKRSRGWLVVMGLFLLTSILLGLTLPLKLPLEVMDFLHGFTLGGTLGCVIAHLWFHVFEEPRILP